MTKVFVARLLVAGLLVTSAVAHAEVTAAVAGTYSPGDRKMLASTFVTAVTTWLHRYERKTIEQRSEYVKMQVRYDYVYDLELFVKDDRFEIRVTGSERSRGTPNGQRNATNLAAGLLKEMEKKKRKRNDYRDRWSTS